ncbi:MAG: cob(I)yrinic acid a,c-diamide adenosyltransferase [Flavobacteriales bacterium]|nr:cob(I)yrinic acid a,c-diamide adenosyltransferase [Flavobacteriales bacterium]
MKIYTRTGDKGQTGLLGGERVSKDDARIEAYGTLDELNSHLGLLLDLIVREGALAGTLQIERLRNVQDQLFAIGSRLASADAATAERFQVPPTTDAAVSTLEKWMDEMDSELPTMRNFILPGGHPIISQAHICRTVCRRAERRVVQLAGDAPVEEVLVRYLNRLSDLLFVLARHLHHRLGAPERPWTPRP